MLDLSRQADGAGEPVLSLDRRHHREAKSARPVQGRDRNAQAPQAQGRAQRTPGIHLMGSREPTYSLLAIACFSRHPDALQWAADRLTPPYGPVALASPDFDFHHTKYYDSTMGPGLVKRFLVFDPIVPADCLP